MLIKKKLNSYKIYTYNGIHKGLLNMKIYIFIIDQLLKKYIFYYLNLSKGKSKKNKKNI